MTLLLDFVDFIESVESLESQMARFKSIMTRKRVCLQPEIDAILPISSDGAVALVPRMLAQYLL